MRRLRLFFALALIAMIWVMLVPQGDVDMGPPDEAPQTTTPPPRLPLPLPPRDEGARDEAERPEVRLEGPVDRIVIEKAARKMTVYRDGRALKTYRVALGFAPEGHKAKQGDGRTPEGIYRIDRRNDRSAYHLSLGIDYPRAQDRAAARAAGVSPGGDIFIHGQPNQLPDGTVLPGDWTAGCVAITDDEIAELFAATPMGTEVEIRP